MCLGGTAPLYTCLSAPPTTGRIFSCRSSFPPGQIRPSVFSQRSFFPKPKGRATPLGAAAAAGGGKGGGEGRGGGKRAPGTPACGKLRKYKWERSRLREGPGPAEVPVQPPRPPGHGGGAGDGSAQRLLRPRPQGCGVRATEDRPDLARPRRRSDRTKGPGQPAARGVLTCARRPTLPPKPPRHREKRCATPPKDDARRPER